LAKTRLSFLEKSFGKNKIKLFRKKSLLFPKKLNLIYLIYLMELKNIYSNLSYIIVIIVILVSLNYIRQSTYDLNTIFNWLTIIILTLGMLIAIVLIKKMNIPVDLIKNYNISETGARNVVIFIIFTTYISFVQIPIKNLINTKIIKKKGIPGEKGERGNRGKQGNIGVCDKCNNGSLCYKKILYNITLTINWWRKNIKNISPYPDSYLIKNEYLKSKIKQHCSSNELEKIFSKYGAHNNNCPDNIKSDLCGSYDYIYRMWSIWILIILKYEKGLFFINSEQLDENDFINMITDKEDKQNIWNNMFNNTDNTDNTDSDSFNLLIKYDDNEIKDIESSINKEFFKKGIETNQKSPFDEIKKYNAWYWGGDETSKPKINIVSTLINDDSDDSELLRKTCGTDSTNKIKIKETNNFYKLFSTDNTWQKDDSDILTPFQTLGDNKVTFMRAHEYIDTEAHHSFRTYKPVGDVVFNSEDVKKYPFESGGCKPNDIKYFDKNIERLVPKNISSILVAGDVVSPKDYTLVYKYKIEEGINKNITNISIWKPNPPPSYETSSNQKYVALGYVIDTTPYIDEPSEPSTDLIWCVPEAVTDITYKDETIWLPKRWWVPNDIDSTLHEQGESIEYANRSLIKLIIDNNENEYQLNIFKFKQKSDTILQLSHILPFEHKPQDDQWRKLKTKKDLTSNDLLCKPHDPYESTTSNDHAISNECSVLDLDKCESNTKCKWKKSNNNCEYKKRKKDDIQKYSIMKIYE
jgi:hypothetical protein